MDHFYSKENWKV